jgi:hypothetical protein
MFLLLYLGDHIESGEPGVGVASRVLLLCSCHSISTIMTWAAEVESKNQVSFDTNIS